MACPSHAHYHSLVPGVAEWNALVSAEHFAGGLHANSFTQDQRAQGAEDPVQCPDAVGRRLQPVNCVLTFVRTHGALYYA